MEWIHGAGTNNMPYHAIRGGCANSGPQSTTGEYAGSGRSRRSVGDDLGVARHVDSCVFVGLYAIDSTRHHVCVSPPPSPSSSHCLCLLTEEIC